MSAKTNYFENMLLNILLRADAAKKTEFNAASMRIALFTNVLTETSEDAASETEVSATGYSRQTPSASNFATASTTGTISNTATITFGPFTTSPGTIQSVGLVDQTTGKIWMYSVLTSPASPGIGASLNYTAGGFTVNEA